MKRVLLIKASTAVFALGILVDFAHAAGAPCPNGAVPPNIALQGNLAWGIVAGTASSSQMQACPGYMWTAMPMTNAALTASSGSPANQPVLANGASAQSLDALAVSKLLENQNNSNCSTQMTNVQNALEKVGDGCPQVSSALLASMGSSSSSNSAVEQAVRSCQKAAKSCQDVEVNLDSSAENDGSLDPEDLSGYTKSCLVTANGECSDLKDESVDLQSQMKDLQDQIVQNSKDDADAQATYQTNLTQAQQNFQNQMTAFRKDDTKTASDLRDKLSSATQQAQSAAQQLQSALNQIQTSENQLNEKEIQTETSARTALRAAYKACIDRATAAMTLLEQQRKQAIANFSNNTGSLSNLTQSVNNFKSNYNRVLNDCLSKDYALAVSNVNDQIIAAQKTVQLEFQSAETQRQQVITQLQQNNANLSTAQRAAISDATTHLQQNKQDETIAEQQYQQTVTNMQAAEARREQNSQLAKSSLTDQYNKLNTRVMTNAAQSGSLTAAGVTCTKSSSTRATSKLQDMSKATSGLLTLQSACQGLINSANAAAQPAVTLQNTNATALSSPPANGSCGAVPNYCWSLTGAHKPSITPAAVQLVPLSGPAPQGPQ